MISSTLHQDFLELGSDMTLLHQLQDRDIYITGGTGQIGWYLVHFLCHLIHQGTLRCHLTVHVRNSQKWKQKYNSPITECCHFVFQEDATVPLKQRSFDFIFHCAALASPKHFTNSPVDVMYPAAVLTHRMLEIIQASGSASTFVYLSTTGVTGFVPDSHRPSSELEFGPLSCSDLTNCYLESKRYGEMICLAFHRQYNIPVYVIRPSITYGPGFDLDDGRSYADFVRFLLQKRPISLSSDGTAIRNFLYVSDFIRGLMTVLGQLPAGTVINVASPYPISIFDLATKLNDFFYPNQLNSVFCQPQLSPPTSRVNFQSTHASVDRLLATGWFPRVDLIDGFRRTVAHYQENMT